MLVVAPVCGSGPEVLEVNTPAAVRSCFVEFGVCDGGWLSVVLSPVLLARLK